MGWLWFFCLLLGPSFFLLGSLVQPGYAFVLFFSSCFTVFSWYPWKACCFLKGNERSVLQGWGICSITGHGKAECWANDCTYPTWCWAIGKHQDIAPGVGKHSLRHGKVWAGLGVPGPVTRPGQWGSQISEHPSTDESHRRAENRVGAGAGGGYGLCLAGRLDGSCSW